MTESSKARSSAERASGPITEMSDGAGAPLGQMQQVGFVAEEAAVVGGVADRGADVAADLQSRQARRGG